MKDSNISKNLGSPSLSDKSENSILLLQRETIRELSQQELKEAWGGSNGSGHGAPAPNGGLKQV